MKGVVVTGASTGIGLATVVALAGRGYVAFAGVRNDADARRLGAIHSNVRPLRLDVTDAGSIADAVAEVKASGIAPFGIVSNAGIAIGGPLEVLPIDELRRQFDVNVFGALHVVQAFLPGLPEGSGRIVFVGSIAGRLATPYVGAYSASKFALRGLADALRVELAPAGIAVSLIEPGSVKTPIWAKGRAYRERMEERLSGRARPHYRPAVASVVAQTEIEERGGMPVEIVSDAIVEALIGPNPPAARVLGIPARIGSVLALLPPAWRDRALRRR